MFALSSRLVKQSKRHKHVIFKDEFCRCKQTRIIFYIFNVCYSGGMLRILSLCIFLPCIFSEEVMPGNGKFWYFAYGSNLLDKRILINNPSAVREIHAKLEGYRLDFVGFSRRWGGAVATIEPESNGHMWGAVWQMENSNIESLDRQEGVQDGVYSVLNVTVTTEEGKNYNCRTYRYNLKEPITGGSYGNLPENRRPSALYLETILRGATQSNLPKQYVDLLSSIQSNGFNNGLTLDQFLDQTYLVNKKV